MTSLIALNTVGRRLRSSSGTVPVGSPMTTRTWRAPPALSEGSGWPASASAASIAGKSTVPRLFSAVAVSSLPQAANSTHGSM